MAIEPADFGKISIFATIHSSNFYGAIMKPKDGDTVSLIYTCALESGEIVDSSPFDGSFDFVIGMNQVIPGLEKAVREMEYGESLNVFVLPEDAYGFSKKELIVQVEKDKLPEPMTYKVGLTIEMTSPEGARAKGTV